MKPLILYLGYLDRRLGRITLAGGTLIIFALIFLATLSYPAYKRLLETQAQASNMRNSIGKRERIEMPVAPAAAINAFYIELPLESKTPDLLEKLFDAAYENNLYLGSIEYHQESNQAAAFIRYRITLPVSGGYKNIRQFINKVLQEMPFAALDNIAFSRDDVRNAELDARFQISLYLKKQPAR